MTGITPREADRRLLHRLNKALLTIEDLTDFQVNRRPIVERIEDALEEGRLSREWISSFVALAEYKASHGLADPPRAERSALHLWVVSQRERHYDGTMPEAHQELLRGIGFALDPTSKETTTASRIAKIREGLGRAKSLAHIPNLRYLGAPARAALSRLLHDIDAGFVGEQWRDELTRLGVFSMKRPPKPRGNAQRRRREIAANGTSEEARE